ncbi:eukaryotic translation initiation factor 3 subunit C-like [Penaeus japonicus]|uniref:eukaryotic translation initiation factor 3 subunit C-like n=1 Tax=Penaeus japonicus TaxID=27405 RepID=UPI001C712FED|nr:eukaryotic translation initiation factor 3 subunit C-like [Penaeus japonicus]XP_042891519.1 eukaryotic translation initiation factor 3 subunit C-like [Penaeus japonicus]XP_042891527.1 eukaryotic translation initiation factor 3 subunit C-like [Penaeus japonicus]
MTSRFFMSDSETESESSEEEIVKEPAISSAAFVFSEDEEDTKRVVRSAKEKRYEEIKNNIKSIKNYKSIRDLYSVLSSKFPFVMVWSSDSNLFRFQPKNFKCIVT